MGGRSLDCRVFHTIPVFLGAFLALSTGIAAQQDSAAKRRRKPLLHKLVGTLWVDDEARQVVRLEAHLSDTFKLGGGLLASLRKGASRVIEQARTKDEVWLPSYVEAHLSARTLLFENAHGDYTSRFSDYKKFRGESAIVTLKNEKRDASTTAPPSAATKTRFSSPSVPLKR